MYQYNCLHSFSSLARPYVHITPSHRQHRLSSKECYATSTRRSGLLSGTSDRPLPLHWVASASALRHDLNPRSRCSCPQSSKTPMWLPRALSCRATSARSAFNPIRTRAPSRPVGPSLHPTLFLPYQALCHSSPPHTLTYVKLSPVLEDSPFHHLCNSVIPICDNFLLFSRSGHLF